MFLFLIVGLPCLAHSYAEFEVPDCLSLSSYGSIVCHEQSQSWCEWDDENSVCLLTETVNAKAMFADWYKLEVNIFWVFGIPSLYCIIFQLSKHICKILLKKHIISKSYFEKCVIYIFEIIGIVPVLVGIFYPDFIYNIIFDPHKYDNPTPEIVSKMFQSGSWYLASLVVMYLMEMVYANNMRWQLQCHHWVVTVAS